MGVAWSQSSAPRTGQNSNDDNDDGIEDSVNENHDNRKNTITKN